MSDAMKENLRNKLVWSEKRYLPHRKLHHVTDSLGAQRSREEACYSYSELSCVSSFSSDKQPEQTSHNVTLVVFHITSVNRCHPLTNKSEQVRVFKEAKKDKEETTQESSRLHTRIDPRAHR
jgi:hypothetical protein